MRAGKDSDAVALCALRANRFRSPPPAPVLSHGEKCLCPECPDPEPGAKFCAPRFDLTPHPPIAITRVFLPVKTFPDVAYCYTSVRGFDLRRNQWAPSFADSNPQRSRQIGSPSADLQDLRHRSPARSLRRLGRPTAPGRPEKIAGRWKRKSSRKSLTSLPDPATKLPSNG